MIKEAAKNPADEPKDSLREMTTEVTTSYVTAERRSAPPGTSIVSSRSFSDAGVITADGGDVDAGTIEGTPVFPTWFYVYGTLLVDTTPIAGVGVLIEGIGSDTTDAAGFFAIAYVPLGPCTIGFAKDGYTFTPSTKSITIIDAHLEVTGITVEEVSISGTIEEDAIGLGGVTVALTGQQTDSTVTDVDGEYAFAPCTDGDYTVTPSKTNWEFVPSSDSVTIDGVSGVADFEANQVGWSFATRRTLTFDKTKVGATQTNFPVWVAVTGIDKTKVLSGQDFAFYDAADSTRLPFEFIYYDSSGATGILYGFVKVPTLSASASTVVYLHYGNDVYTQPIATATYGRSNAWNSSYYLVDHMFDVDTSHTRDATVNAFVGTKISANLPVQSGTAKTYKTEDFEADSGAYINYGGGASLNPLQIVICAWIQREAGQQPIASRGGSNTEGSISGFQFVVSGSAFSFKARDSANTLIKVSKTYSLAAGLKHVGVLYEATPDCSFFVNGVALTSLTKTELGNGTLVCLGSDVIGGMYDTAIGANGFMDGLMGELWILSATGIDANWFLTVYNNQTDASLFHAIGAEEVSEKLVVD